MGAGKIIEIWSGARILVLTAPLPERNASPVEECNAGSMSRCMVKATSSEENGLPSEKATPWRSLKVICLPSFDSFHDSASSGSRSWVLRLTRTSTPPVRYRIDSEASSSTRSGSKVFGSERRQKRNSPPVCEKATAERRAKHRSVKERLSPRNPRRPSVLMQSPLRSIRAAETTSLQRSAAAKAPAATVLRGTKSFLPVRAADFPMTAAVRQRLSRGFQDLLRSR